MKKTHAGALAFLVVLSMLLPRRVDAQSQGTDSPRSTTAEQAQRIEDPLGRTTPDGTVTALVRAAQQENLDRATEYLDSGLRPGERRELAQKLGVVLDRKLVTSLDRLSTRPEGDLKDGLADRDRVGLVESPSGDVEVFLYRVQRGSGDPIWLFSSRLLPDIRRLYDEVESSWIERFVPEPLRTIRWLSQPLYRWIAFLLAIPLILGFATLANRGLTALLLPTFRRLAQGHDDDRALTSAGPLRMLVFALFFYLASFLGISLTSRQLWHRVAMTLAVIALCWLTLRLIDLASAVTLKRLERANRSGDTAMVRLLSRLSKAAAVIVAGLVLLYLASIDLTAALTGLGVGGLALGFGAQKTIENLFGGIMVISDKRINVGDMCRAGEFFGMVEDIGLRSTRIRTLGRTVVSIPNGQLAAMSLENFAERERIWFHHILGLRQQTTPDQLRDVLARIQRVLAAHPKVDATSARTRFIRFSRLSLDLEVFAYVFERDWAAFLAVQEELLLGIMDVVDASGTAFAFPVPMIQPGEEQALET